MLEKEPSEASHDITLASQPASATPGGPFPENQPLKDADFLPPRAQSCTLQFLISMIKKLSQ